MADVTVRYKNSVIAEMNSEGIKTLSTSGQYCEGDISISYVPPASSDTEEARYKTYELTLTKSSGWVLLTSLDSLVLSHINDPSLCVTLTLADVFAYDYYTVTFACASNTQQSIQNSYPAYGTSIRKTSEANIQCQAMYYPANKTDTSTSLGGAQFRINDGKYYFRPTDGWIHAGTYRLTFTW